MTTRPTGVHLKPREITALRELSLIQPPLSCPEIARRFHAATGASVNVRTIQARARTFRTIAGLRHRMHALSPEELAVLEELARVTPPLSGSEVVRRFHQRTGRTIHPEVARKRIQAFRGQPGTPRRKLARPQFASDHEIGKRIDAARRERLWRPRDVQEETRQRMAAMAAQLRQQAGPR